MVGDVALGHGEGNGDHALLLLAADGAHALGLGDLGNVADAHHFALVAGGNLNFQILQILRRDVRIAAVDQIDGQRPAVQRRLRDLGLAGDFRCHELQHLADGQIFVDGLFLVHGDAQLGHGILQPVVDLRRAVHAADDFGHIRGDGAQLLDLRAGDVHRNARAGEHGDVHGAGLHGEVETHVVGDGADVPGDGCVAAARVGIDDHVVAQLAAAAHHRRGSSTVQTHGGNSVHGHDAVHQLHSLLALLRLVALGIPGQRTGHLGGIDRRHEGHAHARHLQHRDRQQRHRRQQHQRLEAQRTAKQAHIAALDGREDGLPARLLLLLQQAGRHGGHQRHGHQQACQKRIGDDQTDVGEQIPRQTRDEQHGQKHADGGQRGGEQRAGDLAHALDARRQNGQMLLVAQAIDVLDSDDGVIHQHAHAQRQTRQGQHVERDAREVHAHEGDDHAEGNGEGDDDRRTIVHQEDQQDQHRQQAAGDQIIQHRVDDDGDVVALIEQVDDAQRAVCARQLGVLGRHALGNVGGGEGGLLFNGQQNAVPAVELGEGVGAVVGDLHRGHVHEAHVLHRIAAHMEQLHGLQLVQRRELVAHAHEILVLGHVVDIARGHGHVLRAKDSAHSLEGNHAVQPRVLQRLVPLFLKFGARLGKLRLRVAELGLGLCKAVLGLLPTAFQLRPRVGNAGVLVDALDHTAGDDTRVQLFQHRVDLGDARVQLGLALHGGGILPVQLVLVQCQLERLVLVGILDLRDGFVQLGEGLFHFLDGLVAAADRLIDARDFQIHRGDARVQPVDLPLGLVPAALQIFALNLVQRLLLLGELVVQRFQLGVLFIQRLLRLLHGRLLLGERRLGLRKLLAQLLGRALLRLRGEEGRFRALRRRVGGRGRRIIRRCGRRFRHGRGAVGRLRGGRLRRRGGFFRGGRRVGRSRSARLRVGRRLCRSRRRGGGLLFPQQTLQLVHMALSLGALIRSRIQRALRRGDLALLGGDLPVQRLNFRLNFRRIRLVQVGQIALISVLFGRQLGAPGHGLGSLLIQRVAGLSRLQLVELLLKAILLRLQIAQLLFHLGQQRALLVGQPGQLFQLRDGLLQLLLLGDQLGTLSGQLFHGLTQLRLAALQLLHSVADLAEGLLLRPGQLGFSVGDLRLRVVELLLRVGQLRVDIPKNGAVEHVDAALVDGHIHLLRNHAGGRDGGHAVDGLVLRHQLLLDIARELEDVHVVANHGDDGHRQHVGIDLHDGRRADGIAPCRRQRGDLGVDLDHGGVHVRRVVELQHHQRQVVAGLGRYVLDVRQRGERRLHRPRHLILHLLRRRADIGRVHDDVGEVHVGQQIGGHVRERNHAQNQHQNHAHNDRIGLFDRVFSEHCNLRLWYSQKEKQL